MSVRTARYATAVIPLMAVTALAIIAAVVTEAAVRVVGLVVLVASVAVLGAVVGARWEGDAETSPSERGRDPQQQSRPRAATHRTGFCSSARCVGAAAPAT
jgi:hypothetical protein